MAGSVPYTFPICLLHRVHLPKALTPEWHHVIPVAWQLKTPVANPPFPGKDPNGRGMLWDARGVWLCPTGHRNVHHWIVAMMRAAALANSDDPLVAYKAAKPRFLPKEFAVAYDALTRLRGESGQGLVALTAVGEWGQV